MTKINLILKYKNTIYENVECVEFVDTKLLNGFINNKLGVNYGDDPKDAYKYKLYDNEHKQILAYMKQKKVNKKNCYNVSQSLPVHKWGRVLPNKYLSLSVMQRKTRHALCDKYIDIDMINCHSNIYLHIAKEHNLKHDTLQAYCDNPKRFRDSIIKLHFPTNTLNESDKKTYAKNLLIALSNGGAYDTWKKKHNINISTEMKLIKDYETELLNIRNLIYDNNKHICDDIIKHDVNHFKKYENSEKNLLTARQRTTMALYGQTVERHIQEHAIKFLVDKYNIQLKYIVSCQDGFMILKTAYKEDMINEINQHIEDSLNISIEFMEKPFDEAIDIPSEDYIKEEYLMSDLEKYYNMHNLLYTEINQPKLDISYTEFNNHDTIILQSGTGTGKTQITADLCAQYKYTNSGYNILCLSNLTTILDQINETFKTHNINLVDYRTVSTMPGVKKTIEEYDHTIDDYISVDQTLITDGSKLINNDSFVCINSLWKLHNENFKNTILVIDEPNNILFNLTNNQTMVKSKAIIQTFLRLFKTCHKVILLDAHFNKSIEELITIRDKSYKYYINMNQKFINQNAIKLTDTQIIDKLKIKLDSNTCFIFASDSKAKCEGIYNLLYDHANDIMKQKFKLITRDTDINITELDYDDSIIFISPKVVCGISIITKTPLDSFIYICGESITPIALYQQATRLRTMQNLYYCDNTTNKVNNYKSYEDCEKKISNLMLNYESIINNSTFIDKGKLKIDANFYFRLHVQNEYLTSLNKEDTLKIFQNELCKSGFTLIDDTNNETNTMKQIIKDNKEEYLNKQMVNVSNQLTAMLTDDEKENSTYLATCEYLNIKTPEQFELYTDFVKYDQYKNEFDMFTRLCRTDEYIDSKVDNNNINRHKIDTQLCPYFKVKMLRLYEKIYNIESMNFYKLSCDYKELSKQDKITITKILAIFATKCSKHKPPENETDALIIYGKLMEQCIGKLYFTTIRTRVTTNDKRVRLLQYNSDIDTLLNLMKLKYISFDNFNKSIIDMFRQNSKIDIPIMSITPLEYNIIDCH